jgi:hypothetical protein
MATTRTLTLPADADRIADALRSEAEAQHINHPQYANHWDGWIVATAKRTVKMHGRIVLHPGEFCLMDPRSFETLGSDSKKPGKVVVTVYLPNNLSGCNTSLLVDELDVMA